jgi:RNA polymerase sigma-70 factor (ECF subfamily)
VAVNARFDEEAIARFMAGPYPSIVRAVALVAGSWPAGEDAVHEALARAWERRATIDDLPRWVVTVALNLARRRWRRAGRERPWSDALAADQGREVAADGLLDVRRALRVLPHRQREVIVLHYLLDLPVAEVAAVTGLSDGGVKHALFRARRSLAPLLSIEPTKG